MDLLKEKGAEEMVVIAGGIVPDKDIPDLKKIGISEIFLPGSSTQDIVNWIRKNVKN